MQLYVVIFEILMYDPLTEIIGMKIGCLLGDYQLLHYLIASADPPQPNARRNNLGE
ncbi:Uncharacterised protein [uncultured archaeon]|nr:Uncharacterised protein [uncultured archaeon]